MAPVAPLGNGVASRRGNGRSRSSGTGNFAEQLPPAEVSSPPSASWRVPSCVELKNPMFSILDVLTDIYTATVFYERARRDHEAPIFCMVSVSILVLSACIGSALALYINRDWIVDRIRNCSACLPGWVRQSCLITLFTPMCIVTLFVLLCPLGHLLPVALWAFATFRPPPRPPSLAELQEGRAAAAWDRDQRDLSEQGTTAPSPRDPMQQGSYEEYAEAYRRHLGEALASGVQPEAREEPRLEDFVAVALEEPQRPRELVDATAGLRDAERALESAHERAQREWLGEANEGFVHDRLSRSRAGELTATQSLVRSFRQARTAKWPRGLDCNVFARDLGKVVVAKLEADPRDVQAAASRVRTLVETRGPEIRDLFSPRSCQSLAQDCGAAMDTYGIQIANKWVAEREEVELQHGLQEMRSAASLAARISDDFATRRGARLEVLQEIRKVRDHLLRGHRLVSEERKLAEAASAQRAAADAAFRFIDDRLQTRPFRGLPEEVRTRISRLRGSPLNADAALMELGPAVLDSLDLSVAERARVQREAGDLSDLARRTQSTLQAAVREWTERAWQVLRSADAATQAAATNVLRGNTGGLHEVEAKLADLEKEFREQEERVRQASRDADEAEARQRSRAFQDSEVRRLRDDREDAASKKLRLQRSYEAQKAVYQRQLARQAKMRADHNCACEATLPALTMEFNHATVQHRVHAEVGLIIETGLESVPQSLLQLTAIAIYQERGNVVPLNQYASVVISVQSVLSKAYVCCNSYDANVTVLKMIAVCIDTLVLFYTTQVVWRCRQADMESCNQVLFLTRKVDWSAEVLFYILAFWGAIGALVGGAFPLFLWAFSIASIHEPSAIDDNHNPLRDMAVWMFGYGFGCLEIAILGLLVLPFFLLLAGLVVLITPLLLMLVVATMRLSFLVLWLNRAEEDLFHGPNKAVYVTAYNFVVAGGSRADRALRLRIAEEVVSDVLGEAGAVGIARGTPRKCCSCTSARALHEIHLAAKALVLGTLARLREPAGSTRDADGSATGRGGGYGSALLWTCLWGCVLLTMAYSTFFVGLTATTGVLRWYGGAPPETLESVFLVVVLCFSLAVPVMFSCTSAGIFAAFTLVMPRATSGSGPELPGGIEAEMQQRLRRAWLLATGLWSDGEFSDEENGQVYVPSNASPRLGGYSGMLSRRAGV